MARTRAETRAENREKLISAARKAFLDKGFADASMDDLTAEAGLTRGALYHNFGDKRGLLFAVVTRIDEEMAARAKEVSAKAGAEWDRLVAEGVAYIGMALDPEVKRIVLLDGPAFLGDPSQWPSQNACLAETRKSVETLIDAGVMRSVDPDAAARLLTGAALSAALWVASHDAPDEALPKAIEVFSYLAEGLRAAPG